MKVGPKGSGWQVEQEDDSPRPTQASATPGWSAEDLLEAPPGHVAIDGLAVPLVVEGSAPGPFAYLGLGLAPLKPVLS